MNDSRNKSDEQDLIELSVKLGEAERKREASILGGMLGRRPKVQRANGAIVDKAKYLVGVRDLSYDYLDSEDMEASVYENTAVCVAACPGQRNTRRYAV
jgi:hypothetical protein